MIIYLAARYARLSELQNYQADLLALGHEVTSRWLGGDPSLDDGMNVHVKDETRQQFALDDIEDIAIADTFIGFTDPPTSSLGARGGRHVEFGIAYAMSKRLIVIGHRQNIFHWLSEVEFYRTWGEALAALPKVKQ